MIWALSKMLHTAERRVEREDNNALAVLQARNDHMLSTAPHITSPHDPPPTPTLHRPIIPVNTHLYTHRADTSALISQDSYSSVFWGWSKQETLNSAPSFTMRDELRWLWAKSYHTKLCKITKSNAKRMEKVRTKAQCKGLGHLLKHMHSVIQKDCTSAECKLW